MSNDSVQIGIDPRTLNELMGKLDRLKSEGGRSANDAMIKLCFDIANAAKLRLTGRGHVKSTRLKNSIHVQSQKPVDTQTYTDENGKSYSKELRTVKLKKDEFAVGTNVEYAAAIEFGSRPHIIEAKNKPQLSNGKKFFGKRVNHPGWHGDSYLYWGMKNVNPFKVFGEQMKDAFKFGKGLSK